MKDALPNTFNKFVEVFYKKPTEPQKLFMKQIATSRYINITPPRQTGLTSIYMLYALYTALDQRDKTTVYVSTNNSDVKCARNKLLGYLKQNDGILMKFVTNWTTSYIRFVNGSSILFSYESDLCRNVRGVRINCLILDNAGWYKTPKAEIMESIVPSISASNGKIIIGSTTEDTPEQLEPVDDYDKMLKADGFDDCIIGICNRKGQPPVLAYNTDKIINKLIKMDKMTRDEATEYYNYNIADAYMGEGTPCFIERIEQ
jgi:hypothetical protein